MQELLFLKSHEGVRFVVSRSEDDFTLFYDHFHSKYVSVWNKVKDKRDVWFVAENIKEMKDIRMLQFEFSM